MRALAGLFLLVCLYYLRFFALRHEPQTVVHMIALLGAAGLLLAPGWPARPPAWPLRWAAALGSAALMLAVLLVFDRDSHSASDTLNRIVPTCCLLAAAVVRLWYPRAAPDQATSARRRSR